MEKLNCVELNRIYGKSEVSALGVSGNKQVVVTNPTNKTIFTWIHSTVSFAKGEMAVKEVDRYGAIGLPSASRVMKTWDDGSVCLLGIKIPYYLTPGGVAINDVGPRDAAPSIFEWHPALLDYLAAVFSDVKVTCQSGGQTLTALPLLGTWKFLQVDPVTIAVRYRTHFYGGMPAVQKELSCTAYAEVETLSPVVKLTFVIGNDSLEKPVSGGIEVTNFQVTASKPGLIQNDPSYQGHSCILADGQQVAFQYFLNASPTETVFQDTIEALAQCQIVGLQVYGQHQESKGLMTHFDLPNPRFGVAELVNVHNQVDAQNAAPLFANAKEAVWGINKNPPSTGDQPDFGAGHPMTKVLQSYSMRLFNRHFVGVLKDSFRPSHYWENGTNGPEYCSLTNYTTLFFWSGRPHWHPSWNPEYPVWQARGQLNTGDMGGWGGADNQHTSNQNLRAVYELSGNWYLRDLCHSYVSVVYWNFFNPKWAGATEAERSGRIMKEAYALASLFRDTPEGQFLLNAVQVKGGVFDAEVSAYFSQYKVPALAPFNSCDSRVNGGTWCAPYPGNTIAVAWQTGFHMEWEWTRSQIQGVAPDLRYLMHVDKYFNTDGTPKTYFPLPAPADAIYGGIGLSWWAGWVMMAEKFKKEPTVATQCQFILSAVKPRIQQQINSSVQGYFGNEDRWQCWA